MTFEEALNFRHACKIFDEDKKIDAKQFEQILRAGVLAPSSMGMQPWEFEVIRDVNLRVKMRAACWNQVQITSASEIVVIYAKIADLQPSSNYAKSIVAARKDKSTEEQNAYLSAYAAMLSTNEGTSDAQVFAWSRAQCYIAAQTMMMQAAILGIDSCPIEGFERGKLQEVLGVNSHQRQVAIVLAFGYRIREAQIKIRREFTDVVKFR